MNRRSPRFRPALEALERRDLMAASIQATLYGGDLYIEDTRPGDFIGVSQVGGQVAVAVNYTPVAISTAAGPVSTVAAGSFRAVAMAVYGGHDFVDLDPTPATEVYNTVIVYAFGGGNTVIGGAGDNTLSGYGGGNTLAGGGGTNYLLSTAPVPGRPDTLIGGSGFNWYYRPVAPGDPFTSGASDRDLQQGSSPICQTLAALAEALRDGHDFAQDITFVGGNTYLVNLHDGGGTQAVFFDGNFNENDPVVRPGSADFWQVLEVRARLQELGINPYQTYTPAQWDQFNAASGGRLYSPASALTAFTGQAAADYTMADANLATMLDVLAHGGSVIAVTGAGAAEVNADGIISDHAYAVVDVYLQDGMWKVTLFNPWGVDSIGGRTLDRLQDGAPPRDDGFITLSWAQFVSPSNFSDFTLGTP